MASRAKQIRSSSLAMEGEGSTVVSGGAAIKGAEGPAAPEVVYTGGPPPEGAGGVGMMTPAPLAPQHAGRIPRWDPLSMADF